MRLSSRLRAVVNFIKPGWRVADIGTDHALLPMYLIRNNISPYVAATDVHAGPLNIARAAVQKVGLAEKIEILLGDGLLPLAGRSDINAIVIAGMGGEKIIEILSLADSLPSVAGLLEYVSRLVLQPMLDAPLVRQWLAEQGWVIVDEDLAREGRHFYEIIAAEKSNFKEFNIKVETRIKGENISELATEVGPVLLAKKPPLLELYLHQRINSLDRALAEMAKKLSCSVQEKNRQETLAHKRNLLKKVIECLYPPKE